MRLAAARVSPVIPAGGVFWVGLFFGRVRFGFGFLKGRTWYPCRGRYFLAQTRKYRPAGLTSETLAEAECKPQNAPRRDTRFVSQKSKPHHPATEKAQPCQKWQGCLFSLCRPPESHPGRFAAAPRGCSRAAAAAACPWRTDTARPAPGRRQSPEPRASGSLPRSSAPCR